MDFITLFYLLFPFLLLLYVHQHLHTMCLHSEQKLLQLSSCITYLYEVCGEYKESYI